MPGWLLPLSVTSVTHSSLSLFLSPPHHTTTPTSSSSVLIPSTFLFFVIGHYTSHPFLAYNLSIVHPFTTNCTTCKTFLWQPHISPIYYRARDTALSPITMTYEVNPTLIPQSLQSPTAIPPRTSSNGAVNGIASTPDQLPRA